MTPLDQAFIAASSNENERNNFYTLFLNSMIYIPTHNAPEQASEHRAGEQESINPIFVESNGLVYLMLFDSVERLSGWAQKEVGYVAIPGHAIVEMMGTDLHWALNVGTDFTKIFVPEEISWLKQTVSATKIENVEIKKGTEVMIGIPKNIPSGLLEKLQQNFSTRNKEIQEAYLGHVSYAIPSEKPRLSLVLRLNPVSETTMQGIRKDIFVAIDGMLASDENIDIHFNDNEIATAIIRTVKPFYVRK